MSYFLFNCSQNLCRIIISINLLLVFLKFCRYKSIAAYRGAPVYSEWLATLESVNLLISNKITNTFLERMKDNILYAFVIFLSFNFIEIDRQSEERQIFFHLYFRKEVRILIALFKAQEAMVMFNVKDSTLLLYQAKLDLGHWIRSNGILTLSLFSLIKYFFRKSPKRIFVHMDQQISFLHAFEAFLIFLSHQSEL